MDGTNVLESYYTNVPDNPVDILEVLSKNGATLDQYLHFALEYYKKRNVSAFKTVLKESKEVIFNYPEREKHLLAISNCLAAFYIHSAFHEKDRMKVANLFDEATICLNTSDKLDMTEPLTWLYKGILMIYRNEFFSAKDVETIDYQLNYVLQKLPDNIPALMGKALIAFESGNYPLSIRTYQKIIKLWPKCPALIINGLGLAFFKLKDYPSAAKCFQCVLSLDSQNIDAIIGLAVVDINAKDESIMNKALTKLRAAYNVDKTNPIVLNHLANHFFFKNEYAKAEALALNAYHHGQTDSLKAESCFILAKIYHTQENFGEAFRFYSLATKFNPDHTPAIFCLGQMHIQKNDNSSATQCFEKVLQKEPNNYETMKILASLYSMNQRDQKKATLLLKKVFELYPDDIEASLEYATYIEQHDHLEALKAYQNAYQKLVDNNVKTIPPELYNNMAVLLHKNERFEESFKFLNCALDEIKNMNPDKTNPYYTQMATTILFNLARLYEEQLLFIQAENIYREILSQDKTYIDCYLRLGLIALSKGHLAEAADHYKDAIGIDENHKEAWILLACQQLLTKAINPSRKTFERVLSKIDKHDYFSLLSLGNIYIQIARHEPRGSKGWDLNLHRALEFFQKCLMLDTKNFYAVNGMAIICAMKGHYAGAREVFLQIRQEESWFPDSWLNTAHTYLEEGHFAPALNIYEHYYKKFWCGKDMSIFLYLAKANYLLGKSHKDPNFFAKAITLLQKALLYSPFDHTLRFNLALVQQEFALSVLNKSISARSFSEVSKAIHELDVSSLTFEILGDSSWTPEGNRLFYDPKIAKQRAKFCQSAKLTAQKQYQKQVEEEKAKQDKLQKLKLMRETELEKKRLLEEELRRKKATEEASIDEQRKAAQEKARTLQAHLQGSLMNERHSVSDDEDDEMNEIGSQRKLVSSRTKPTDDSVSEAEEDFQANKVTEEDSLKEADSDADDMKNDRSSSANAEDPDE